MKKTIACKCANCDKEFEKCKHEVRRRINKGQTDFYCSRKCSLIVNSRNIEIANADPLFREKSIAMCKLNNLHPEKRLRKSMFSEYRPFFYYINRIKNRINNKVKCKNTHKWDNCDIDLEYLKMIWDEQKGICPYTKHQMILELEPSANRDTPYHASLDRIDSNKSYVKDNVEFVCLGVNFLKNKYTKEVILEFLKPHEKSETK